VSVSPAKVPYSNQPQGQEPGLLRKNTKGVQARGGTSKKSPGERPSQKEPKPSGLQSPRKLLRPGWGGHLAAYYRGERGMRTKHKKECGEWKALLGAVNGDCHLLSSRGRRDLLSARARGDGKRGGRRMKGKGRRDPSYASRVSIVRSVLDLKKETLAAFLRAGWPWGGCRSSGKRGTPAQIPHILGGTRTVASGNLGLGRRGKGEKGREHAELGKGIHLSRL